MKTFDPVRAVEQAEAVRSRTVAGPQVVETTRPDWSKARARKEVHAELWNIALFKTKPTAAGQAGFEAVGPGRRATVYRFLVVQPSDSFCPRL